MLMIYWKARTVKYLNLYSVWRNACNFGWIWQSICTQFVCHDYHSDHICPPSHCFQRNPSHVWACQEVIQAIVWEISISRDITGFAGWQKQNNASSCTHVLFKPIMNTSLYHIPRKCMHNVVLVTLIINWSLGHLGIHIDNFRVTYSLSVIVMCLSHVMRPINVIHWKCWFLLSVESFI